MRKIPLRRWVPVVVIGLMLAAVVVIEDDGPALKPVGDTIAVPATGATLSPRAALTPDAGSSSGQVVRFADDAAPEPSGFVHPGVLMDRDQLDYVKAQVALGNQPWADSFAKAKSQKALATRTPQVRTMLSLTDPSLKCDPDNPGSGCVVNCGSGSNPNNGCTDETLDFEAANTQALLWYLTGDETYAQSAVAILNAWSAVLRNHTGSNATLQAAWSAESVVRAAEILRYTYTPSAGLPAFDVDRFTTMLRTAFLPVIGDTSAVTMKNGNWDLAVADATMNIAVFTDDRGLFDSAVSTWRARVPAYIYRTSDGPLPVAPPGGQITGKSGLTCFWLNNASGCSKASTTFQDGQSQETCRDTSHVAMGFASLFDTAETAYVQGVDLYSAEKERLAAGLENVTRLINTVKTVTDFPSDFCVGHGTLLKPIVEPTFEIAYNALADRDGVSLPQTLSTLRRLRDPSALAVNRMMAFETLTHADTGNRCGTPANRFGKAYLGATVPTAGDFRLWVRVKGPANAPGSVDLQVDGGCAARLGWSSSSGGQWTWVTTTADSSALTKTLADGKHLFTVTPGTGGVAVDQVLLTDDPDCVPDDQGCPVVPADTTVPTQPTGLTAGAVTDTTASLSWEPSTDDVVVQKYQISRDNVVVGTTTDTTFTDRGLRPATTYGYTVQAVDRARNPSVPSESLDVTTAPTTDAGPPTTPTGLASSGVTTSGASLSWSPSTDDVAVHHYAVSRDGTLLTETSGTGLDDTGLQPDTAYRYTVVAVDAVGNASSPSEPLVVTTPPLPPPSAPGGLTATEVTDSTVTMSWGASSGARPIARYVVRRGGTPVAETLGTSWTDQTVQPSTGYDYSVVAVDARGVSSAPSTVLTVTTRAPVDRTPPSAPGAAAARVTGLGQVAVSWAASTDNVGVNGYRISRNGVPLGTQSGTSYADSGLAPGTSYTYSVTAVDAAGNASLPSSASVTTALDAAPFGAGFAASYFNNMTLSGPAIGRLDPSVSFAWGTGSPAPGINADKFSARWTGQLTAPRTGSYTFYVQGDNGVRLYVNDKLLVDTWNATPNTSASGTTSLTAGTAYNVRVEYVENTGSAGIKLQWSGPGIAKSVVPSTVVTSGSRGLSAAFFGNTDLTGSPLVQRLDSAVNFAWGTGSPDTRIPVNGFGATWTGKVTAPATGPVTFWTDTDDGVRLWVGNQLVIDTWSTSGLTSRSASVNLVAKTLYDLKVAYRENTSTATAKLSWAYGTTAKTVVPTAALRDR